MWTCHVTDLWELFLSQSQASIQVGLINGQDLFMVDPWAYSHRLGSLHRLTNHHTYRISPCVGFTTVLEEQPSPLDAKVVHPRTNRHPQPPSGTLGWAPTFPLPTNTPPSLYTINSRCGARWRSAPIHFQALQASLGFLDWH